MQRYDEIENLNMMSRKCKVFDEKKLREQTIRQRQDVLNKEKENEINEDRQ